MLVRQLFYINKVMRQQWYTSDKLKEYQNRKLRCMLQHAYNNSSFYHEKFQKNNITPDDIHGLEDLHRIPFTSKKEIIDNFPDKIITKNYRFSRLVYKKTSGSSGLQMTIATDPRCEDFYDAVYGRALFNLGYRPWQPMAYFWPPTYHRKKTYEHFFLMRKDWLSSTLSPERQAAALAALKPGIIYAFPTSLVAIAKIIEKNRENYKGINPRFIISHAETLFEDSRDYLESVFGCPVYNEYGTTEFVRMAWECKERKGLHIDIDSIILEVLKNGKPCRPGEPGEIVLTGIHNYAMPIIRYRIGDIGVLSDKPCPCGRRLPLLKRVEGRTDSFLVLPSGRIISPRNIVPLIEKFRQIAEFRLVQEDKDKMVLYIVDNSSAPGDLIARLKKELYNLIDKEVDLKIERVTRLEKNERGKMQAVVSKVKLDLFGTP